VHHRGAGPLRDVRVRVLAVPACLRLPDLPVGDWLLGGEPPAGSPWRPVGPPAAVGDLDPGRSAVASFDWRVPWDLPREICLLAVAAAGGPTAGGWATGGWPEGGSPGGLWTAPDPAPPAGLPSRFGGPAIGGRGSGVPAGPGGLGATGPGGVVAVDPADLVAGDGRWGVKSLTVLGRAPERVLKLDLLGSAGRGPFTLAAEGWLAEVVAGLVLPPRLGRLAGEAGLVAERVGDRWRPELVRLVREDPRYAEWLDLKSAFAVPAGPRGAGLEPWLRGMELASDRPEPFLLLLREPPASGRGSLLLLDVDGGVLGGHTFRAAG
jgi:hypothetical protein